MANQCSISIHAPQWGATLHHSTVSATQSAFQSTHPSGVRLYHGVATAYCRLISIHAPQWGATFILGTLWYRYEFQSTHPSGVRRGGLGEREFFVRNFNPRTPVGCDPHRLRQRHDQRHFNPRTPVGCDDALRRVLGLLCISIHAPQWGATSPLTALLTICLFQSTHPSGVRPYRTGHMCTFLISIHAPQWGATFSMHSSEAGGVIFQSTHPSGVRRSPSLVPFLFFDFNPRTPVGCDSQTTATLIFTFVISIHAPQWGATRIRR